MHSAYTNLVKSAKEVLCNIDWTLKFRSPDIRCHVADFTDKSRIILKKNNTSSRDGKL